MPEDSEEDLSLLSKDIFIYFGLGCRNVSKIFIPEGYDITHLIKNIYITDILNINSEEKTKQKMLQSMEMSMSVSAPTKQCTNLKADIRLIIRVNENI